MKKILLGALATLTLACNPAKHDDSIEKWKNEILNTEKEFAAMAMKEGIPTAFSTYAADDAVLQRNNSLIIGKESIRIQYQDWPDNATLSWNPDFVDVSSSGDLGYTYGKYVYTATDSSGTNNVYHGIFHTVWKRQPDGTWRFVWD
jgi:ketosteroid isomerase-like protein